MVQCNMKGSTMGLSSADFSAVLQLTRAGHLMDATRAIQAALGGGGRAAESSAPPPVAPWQSHPEDVAVADVVAVAERADLADLDDAPADPTAPPDLAGQAADADGVDVADVLDVEFRE